jgi:hypothetical protein
VTEHRSLYVGLAVACVVCALLAVLALRPRADFPRSAPLVEKVPENLDEWPTK